MLPIAEVALTALGLFVVCGLGPTRLLLPASLRRYEPLWVPAVGAGAAAGALTLLGYAHVPFKASLALTLAAGALLAAVAVRRRPRALPGALGRSAWPVYLAALVFAVALIPLFRAGFLTVEGYGQDAHLAVGTATFLQHHYPTAVAPQEPVDRVPLVWRSKPPIYYVLGAVSTLSGREPYQAISTVLGVMLALAALGFFLVAREMLRAPPWAALVALGLVGIDRMVLHTVVHPYYNQTWGFFALPFALVLSWWAAVERTRGGLLLLALFLALCAFAYPLALPIPLLALAAVLWQERRRAVRRVWHGRRSLLWLVPLAALLAVPLVGVAEKIGTGARVVLDPGYSLADWGGDLNGWYSEPWFFALRTWFLLALLGAPLLWGLWHVLRALPRDLRRGMVAVLAFALAAVVIFRLRAHGYYFHFKVLAFVAPLAIAIAVAGLARRGARWGKAVLAVWVLLAVSAAAAELALTYDQLPRTTLALRQAAQRVPPGRSIRLDVAPQQQNWVAYMLAARPLCSQLPLLNTSYPHVPWSRKADYILTPVGARRPRDAVSGPPVMRLKEWTLYRERAGVPGPSY
ncbi:MAG TPA: hypothetical protein VFT42_08245, partial [Solirubrobacteraceae bacterium]|nr:hypothetical protein [Solirubrobacteraceae bacterium]